MRERGCKLPVPKGASNCMLVLDRLPSWCLPVAAVMGGAWPFQVACKPTPTQSLAASLPASGQGPCPMLRCLLPEAFACLRRAVTRPVTRHYQDDHHPVAARLLLPGLLLYQASPPLQPA